MMQGHAGTDASTLLSTLKGAVVSALGVEPRKAAAIIPLCSWMRLRRALAFLAMHRHAAPLSLSLTARMPLVSVRAGAACDVVFAKP